MLSIHHMHVSLLNLCVNRDQGFFYLASTLSAIPLVPAECLESKKKQNHHIYDDALRVIFGMSNRFTDILADDLQACHCCLRETRTFILCFCVELSALWHCRSSRSSHPLTRSHCPGISAVLLRSAPPSMRDNSHSKDNWTHSKSSVVVVHLLLSYLSGQIEPVKPT